MNSLQLFPSIERPPSSLLLHTLTALSDFKAMKASLIRTGSVPIQKLTIPNPLKVCLARHLSLSGDEVAVKHSPTIALRLNSHDQTDFPERNLNRAFTESDAIRSPSENYDVYMKLLASRSFTGSTPDEEYLSENELGEISEGNCIREPNYAEVCAERGRPLEEIGFYGGGGAGDGGDHGIRTITGGNGRDRMKIVAYYEEMLKSNPADALLLGNYGKFLYQVEKDMVRAEEYYGRAIVSNPEDGELLSMYGKLIWETHRDEDRAKSYFDQALHAAPDDCTVLGSYAHFMWEAEEDGEANSLSFS